MDVSEITSAFSSMVTDTISLFMGILPVALTVFATVWGVQKAIRFFKTATN